MKTLCLKSCLQCDKPKYQLALSYIFKDRSITCFATFNITNTWQTKKIVLPTRTLNYTVTNLSNEELRDRIIYIYIYIYIYI